ncbi:hypothetical protein ACFXMT_14240 [Streptomyces mirabilis]|uniref:hypothetical protein n=1 Tax=Streptomyces mirabilis TaxID=68239 RepID=UPI0036C00FE2
MPLTDSYGQGITYPTLTDKPNAQTLGQGIVDGLTPKTVMSFASAIVRGATIATPKAGMVTWLKDVGRLEVYDGTGWAVVSAGTSTWKTIMPSPPSYTQNGNSQGNFSYRIVNLFGEMGIMFRGGVGVNYLNKNVVTTQLNFNQLPIEARPSSLRTLVVPCSDANSARITLKMDVQSDGYLKLYGIQSDTNPPWVGFNGVFCSL